MKKWLKLSKYVIILICFGAIPGSCQNPPIENKQQSNNDSSSLTLQNVTEESFRLNYKTKNIFDATYWANKKIGMLLIPINDTLGLKLGFSYSGILINKSECRINNGNYVENGKSYRFDDNGVLSHMFTFKSGVMNGEYISYFKNGTIESKGNYFNGNKSGEWEYYNNLGKLIKKEKLE